MVKRQPSNDSNRPMSSVPVSRTSSNSSQVKTPDSEAEKLRGGESCSVYYLVDDVTSFVSIKR